MVLLHGLAASNLYWGAAYDDLAADSFLVVPDLLGFGSSDRPDIDYTAEAHAEALAAALSDVGVHGSVLLVAHSTGSIAALAFALLHPRRVAGVLSFGSALYGDPRAESLTVTWWVGAGHDAPLTEPARCLAEIRSLHAHAARPRRIGTIRAQ